MVEKVIQSIKGMNDILPSQILHWQNLESVVRQVFARYGYQEIRFPIVEQTALFVRTIGQATDIVEKEMYTFDDNGESLTLRPEGTAGCVRAVIEAGWLRHNPQARLWYEGPMFRHENPQKGRYRQFYQFGIEAYGLPGPDIDAEQIFMVSRIWQELGLQDFIQLQINSLGSVQCRQNHRQALVEYFHKHQTQLDTDSQRRLTTNPLRILDSKNPDMQQLITQAPKLLDFLDENSRIHFAGFRQLLDAAKINYVINPRLVRGLDYYGYTVYEWVTNKLGAQGTVCAGGRYDALVEQLGGAATPAVGFAMGLERIVALLELVQQPQFTVDAYFVTVGEEAKRRGMILAEQLRQQLPQLKLIVNCGEANFKTQFKRADKSGARWALILGDEELANNKIALKDLRYETPQSSYALTELISILDKVGANDECLHERRRTTATD